MKTPTNDNGKKKLLLASILLLTISVLIIASQQSQYKSLRSKSCEGKILTIKHWTPSQWCAPLQGCPRQICSALNANIKNNEVVIMVPRGVGGGEIYSLEKYKEGTFYAELEFSLSPGVRYAFFLGVFDEGEPQNEIDIVEIDVVNESMALVSGAVHWSANKMLWASPRKALSETSINVTLTWKGSNLSVYVNGELLWSWSNKELKSFRALHIYFNAYTPKESNKKGTLIVKHVQYFKD